MLLMAEDGDRKFLTTTGAPSGVTTLLLAYTWASPGNQTTCICISTRAKSDDAGYQTTY
jgi:hypothetical protein